VTTVWDWFYFPAKAAESYREEIAVEVYQAKLRTANDLFMQIWLLGGEAGHLAIEELKAARSEAWKQYMQERAA
jgi:hypothetical protein